MKFIIGEDRTQIQFLCLEELVDQDSDTRLIDLFVNSLTLDDFGFKSLNNDAKPSDGGRPAYHPKDLLKLFLYGYLNHIRSSRQLEKECKRNFELIWLMRNLVPDHNTISNFRRDNKAAIQKVFRATVNLAKHFELIGGKLLAGDSTKLRAQNSKKRNFNPKKIERHLKYIDAKLEEYNAILAAEDGDDALKHEARLALQTQLSRKEDYLAMQQQLEQSGDTQISLSDTESRQMITRNNITEVAYNVQTTVDDKHCIPIDFVVTNQNDSKAMGAMTRRAKTIIGHNDFTMLYDKGYHTGSEFDYANKHGIEVIVAAPEVASHAPDPAFDVQYFKYDKTLDQYTCPANQTLSTNGRWYNKDRGKSINKVKHYKTTACQTCPLFERCTKNKEGRLIERSEHADLVEANNKRLEVHKKLYRKRQAIVEHPYGVVKRQWGFYYIMTKQGIKRASADVGLIFTAYNLRRIFNLIDPKMLQKFLRELAFIFSLPQTHFKADEASIIFRFYSSHFPKFLFSSASYRFFLPIFGLVFLKIESF
jgi:transposase